MENNSAPRVTVLFALPDEARAFQAKAVSKQARVAISGVGAEKTRRTVESLYPQPSNGEILLICGFAGGLAAGLAVGSVVAAESVSRGEAPGEILQTDAELLTKAEAIPAPNVKGKLVSVPSVLTSPAEKQACANRTGALFVDMETFSAVQTAQARSVKCLAIRAITDGLEDTLPLDFNAFSNAQGEPDRGKIVAHVLLHPTKIPALIRLGGRSAQAAKNLAAFLEALIPTL